MSDTRNVIDYYKYWSTEAIKADLDTKRHNFSVLISNVFYDFNAGSVIRNANAFLAKNVYVYGRTRYDRRATVGTHIYSNIKILKEIEQIDEILDDSTCLIGIDNIPQAKPIETYDWPYDKHVILAFGQEQVGLPDEIIAKCHDISYITQYGSVRSLNVGCASAIAMYSFMLNYRN
jgi:tRNA G18 (ribose-2'-O)-methylase SpoU